MSADPGAVSPAAADADRVLPAVAALARNDPNTSDIVVGFSGGLDSTVLLHACVSHFGADHVVAVHVDHGLQSEAADWALHCAGFAERLGCRSVVSRLGARPSVTPGGLESWARDGRRAALLDACVALSVRHLALGHHADDQVETLLLNWGRGAGPAGMVGMRQVREQQGVFILRPLLALRRGDLLEYAQRHGLAYVEDPSNGSPAFKRNRVRHELLPLLDDVFPGFRGNVLRAALLTRRMLETRGHAEMRKRDDATGRDGGGAFDRREWRTFSSDERESCLRAWLAAAGMRAPTASRTRHMREQLIDGASTYAYVLHDGRQLRRYRDEVSQEPLPAIPQASTAVPESVPLRWQGEARLRVAGWAGEWRFEMAAAGEVGLSRDSLTADGLMVVPLRSSARMRERIDGPQRRLKQLCQEAGMPAWVRRATPMIVRGDRVLYVAGLGINRDAAVSRTGLACGSSASDAAPSPIDCAMVVAYNPDRA